MNERIKELAERAGMKPCADMSKFGMNEDMNPYNCQEFMLEKFAELIVREMCNVLDKAQWDKGEDWVCADGTRIIPQVKEHFGVE